MSQPKKTAALESKEYRKRSPETGHARSPDSAEQKQIDRILADAKIDDASRRFFARAGVRYADLMKRLAEK